MRSEDKSLKRLCNIRSKVSSHFVINERGIVYRLVKESHTAWHAGKSCWGKYKNLNNRSIGIELVNKGHRFGYSNYKKKQLFSLIKISNHLIKKYKIKNRNVVGHSDISPLRKIDPGEKFPWKMMAEKKIGIWHSCRSGLLKKFRRVKISSDHNKIEFIKNLKKIGYCIKSKDKFFLKKITEAFQRHHRKELINGIIDKECFTIAENLTKKRKKLLI